MMTTLGVKKGEMRRIDEDMEAFSETITNLCLVDMDIINGIHTLNNRRGEVHQIACCLNKFLISEQLMSKDIFIEASILPCMGLDHWSVCLEVDLKDRTKNRPFRFEYF